MQKKNMMRNKQGLQQILFYLGLLFVWQAVFYLGTQVLSWWKPYAMPSPVGVFEALIRLLKSKTLLLAAGYSMMRVLAGFLIAAGIGFLLGFLIHISAFLNRTLRPLILGIQTLPSICWVPFAILWFGLGERAILFVVIMGSAFSIALAVEGGIRSVNPLFIKAAKTMGANQQQLYIKVIFPACLPNLVAGLKQGWSFAWRALMSGEVMSSTIGLGQTLMLGRDLADINQVMLVMLVIVLIGVIVDKLVFAACEKRLAAKRGC